MCIRDRSEIEVVNKVENQEEKKYALSLEEVELLLDTARRSALMIAASLSILNNSVVMDDGTDPERIAMIQRGIEQLSSKDITTQIDLLLEDKNSGLIDDASISMLRAFREGMFIGNGIPCLLYTSNNVFISNMTDNLNKRFIRAISDHRNISTVPKGCADSLY